MVAPELKINALKRAPIVGLEQKDNENGRPEVPSGNIFTPFAMKGTQVMYQIADVTQSATLLSPLGDLYNSKRKNYGLYQVRRSIYDKHRAREHVRYTASGACWHYNFGHKNCPHCHGCDNRRKGHLATHVCAACAAKHPIYRCPFIRSFMAIVDGDKDWTQQNYDNKSVKIHIPGFKKYRYDQQEQDRDNRTQGREKEKSRSNRRDEKRSEKRKSGSSHH